MKQSNFAELDQLCVSAPGKLFISGEWGVMGPDCPAVLCPVSRRAYARIRRSTNRLIHLKNLNRAVEVVLPREHFREAQEPKTSAQICDPALKHLHRATKVALAYLGGFKGGFTLEVDTHELYHQSDLKLGLGSSAATNVAAIKAILALVGFQLSDQHTKHLTFKLAAIAHCWTPRTWLGSAADIACCVYETPLIYHNTLPENPSCLINNVNQWLEEKSIAPKYMPINLPKKIEFLAGWSGEAASTEEFVSTFLQWSNVHKKEFRSFASELAGIVSDICMALEKDDFPKLSGCIYENQRLLETLSQNLGLRLVTAGLRRLIRIAHDVGAGAKISGAGGGDCCIAFTSEKSMSAELDRAWAVESFPSICVSGEAG